MTDETGSTDNLEWLRASAHSYNVLDCPKAANCFTRAAAELQQLRAEREGVRRLAKLFEHGTECIPPGEGGEAGVCRCNLDAAENAAGYLKAHTARIAALAEKLKGCEALLRRWLDWEKADYGELFPPDQLVADTQDAIGEKT